MRLHADGTYMALALAATAMFWVPFAEQLGLGRNALQSIQRCIPESRKNSERCQGRLQEAKT